MFILLDDYLRLKKKRKKEKSSEKTSEQICSGLVPSFKSAAWVEAYNGLESLEEAAFFYSLSPFPVIFVILVNTQLCDEELT